MHQRLYKLQQLLRNVQTSSGKGNSDDNYLPKTWSKSLSGMFNPPLVLFAVRFHFLELGMGVLLLISACHNCIFRTNLYFIFIFPLSLSFLTMGSGFVGTYTTQQSSWTQLGHHSCPPFHPLSTDSFVSLMIHVLSFMNKRDSQAPPWRRRIKLIPYWTTALMTEKCSRQKEHIVMYIEGKFRPLFS